uniref:Leucine-rich repeat-containing N-terminal plant-type domain-containing protein n=1 Tax=Entomoneis paludosa TaxID=265537 RepID=A0A7S3DR25_9STRA
MPSNILTLPNLVSLDLSNNHVDVTDWTALQHATSLSRLQFSHTRVTTLEGISGGKDVLTSLFLQGIEYNQQPLPEELFELTKLHTLQLEAADLGGELSTNIAKLTQLRRLTLNENQLQGPIPPMALNNLTQLEFLDLSDNDWTGGLPGNFLEHCVAMIDLRINGARAGLGGPLPSLSTLAAVEVVELAYNSFTGPIPVDFLQASQPTDPARNDITIDLAGNGINGALPSSLALFEDPLVLKLQDNEITSVPSNLCDPNSPTASTTGLWMNGQVATLGCPAILCEPGKWNARGRASADLPCDEVCPGNLLYWGQSTCVDAAPVPNREREILDELFVATGGRYWNKTADAWLDPQKPICAREGVICGSGTDQSDGGVTELRLDRFGLRGSIPTSVYELTDLRRLAVTRNPVQLTFDGIGNAQALEVVMASYTKLSNNLTGIQDSGPVMYSFHLNDCGLSGSFPSEVLAIPSLKDLRLSGNKLTGTLPRSHWDNMVNLENLLLDGNDFNGQIPSEVGGMVSLKILDLSSNQLSGPLPVELSDELTALTELNLANQQGLTSKLNGPLLDFAKAPNLMFLDLSHNQLAGNLPTSFLENVQNGNDTIIVDLSYNQLGGPIPVEWDDLSHLLVYLEANKIDEIAPEVCANTGWMDEMGFDSTTIIAGPVCDWLLCPPGTQSSTGRDSTDGSCTDCDGGIIDAPFYGSVSCSPSGSTGGGGGNNGGGAPGDERSALMAFYDTMKGDEWVHNDNWGSNLNLCTWYGVVCRDDLSVAELRLENNGLTNANAEEPDQSDAIAALSPIEGLRLLDLKGNEINLNFASLPTTTKLEVIRISKTAVTSLAGLEKATKLTSIHAMDNALAGEFPTNILQLSEMTELYLSFNKLNGTLPEAISSLSKLEEMYIYDNELTGMLPASIAQMAELREVVLGENYFHGPIPNEFSNMGNLEQLALQSQKGKELLDGPLPDFTGAPNLWYLDVSNNDIGPTLPDDLLVGSSQKDQPVSLLLRNNDLTGSIPASLDAFKELFIDLADNRITSIPATLCDNTGWMNGAVAEVQSCDSILCPIGYYSDLGRQDTAARPCTKCDQETTGYMGQTTCRVDDSEKAILNMLFEQTGGLSWKKNDKWGTNEPICSWEGVTCAGDLQDEEGVQTINLIDNGLVGTFPSQMFGLPSLVELGLRGNEDLVVSLNGIQNAAATLEVLDVSNTLLESLAWISRATKLKSIYADQAGLIGGFPDELLSIPTLQTIHLNWNFLVGRLPIDIGVQLPGLKYLHVSGNDFHGPIPTSVGFLAELEELILDDNLISGELPSTELSYLPRLRHLSVVRIAKSGRKVTGPLPTLDKVPLLESLGLDNNDLTGTIPENFLSSSVSVQEVVMTHNSLVGGIPDALASLSQVHLAVIANEITKISQEFCDENEWIESTASFFNASCDGFMCPPGTANQFGRGVDLNNPCEPCEDDNGATFYGSTSCEVPADERAILTKIFDDLQGHGWTRNDYWGSKASVCDWYGVSCDNGAVVAINLSSNNLKGDVPSEIFHLPKLQQLLLSSNQIQISFDEIGKAANLLELRLASTGLRSLEGINSAKMLTFLSIASNNLAGQFPDGLFALENLRFLAMNNNALTGPVPEDIGELRYLRYLQLDSNLFNQNVPSFSKSLTLTHVRMAGNELTGEIPADFLRSVPARSTMQVDLSNNRLTGQVPEALGRFDKMTLALQQNQITDLPTSLCGKEDWNDGDVAIYGCDGIMCAPGTSTLDGRHTTGKPCVACPQADPDFFGQALCESVIAPASSSTSIRQWIFRISFLSYVLATAITWLA